MLMISDNQFVFSFKVQAHHDHTQAHGRIIRQAYVIQLHSQKLRHCLPVLLLPFPQHRIGFIRGGRIICPLLQILVKGLDNTDRHGAFRSIIQINKPGGKLSKITLTLYKPGSLLFRIFHNCSSRLV